MVDVGILLWMGRSTGTCYAAMTLKPVLTDEMMNWGEGCMSWAGTTINNVFQPKCIQASQYLNGRIAILTL